MKQINSLRLSLFFCTAAFVLAGILRLTRHGESVPQQAPLSHCDR
jgi:hypothetical protein